MVYGNDFEMVNCFDLPSPPIVPGFGSYICVQTRIVYMITTLLHYIFRVRFSLFPGVVWYGVVCGMVWCEDTGLMYLSYFYKRGAERTREAYSILRIAFTVPTRPYFDNISE